MTPPASGHARISSSPSTCGHRFHPRNMKGNWDHHPHFKISVVGVRLISFTKYIIPALTPNRCRNFQLYCTCEPRNPEWETSVGDKYGRQVWVTSVNSAQRTQSGKQVWETSVGDKCKLMRSQTSRVGDTCGRQVEDKCKIMRPKTPRVEDKCGRQV